MRYILYFCFSVMLVLLLPGLLWASESAAVSHLDLTEHWIGYTAIFIFVVAYMFVMAEEFTHLRKSKPVILAAGIMWGMIGLIYVSHDIPGAVEKAIKHNLLEYSELMLFLLVAMTYINAMEERQIFEALRSWLIRKGFGFRQLFWTTGVLAFFISPIADNLTTALLMCAVVMSVGGNNKRFINLGCINIVVAANAGGAFSPFGDITTLMVWQKGIVDFWTFFNLFIPSLVNFIVPAVIMQFAIPKEYPKVASDLVFMRRGAKRIIFLFFCTIATAVSFHSLMHIPPVIGMLTGLSYLQLFGYYLKKTHHRDIRRYKQKLTVSYQHRSEIDENLLGDTVPFDIFNKISRAEWDTLLFFYGVVLCVGALNLIGYLGLISEVMYYQWGPTSANVIVGILSAIVDNIPIMFAVLSMYPEMSQGQWLLVTLTAGVGGSMLSIGSAAGVALMGQARGKYTFFGHLKWTPVILLGYFCSIAAHWLVNSHFFT